MPIHIATVLRQLGRNSVASSVHNHSMTPTPVVVAAATQSASTNQSFEGVSSIPEQSTSNSVAIDRWVP